MELDALPLNIDYETERGKPMPSKIHAYLTKRLLFLLDRALRGRFESFPELTLELASARPLVPDIAVCEIESIDFTQDEIKRKDPPLAVIEILSPTQVLQTLVDKTNDYFSFGVKSCWLVLPMLQSIYVYSAPHRHEVFAQNDELHDPNLDIRIPMSVIFSTKTPFQI